jgi:hypothetical protein
MPDQNHSKLLGFLCVGARSGIIVALYLAAFLGALQLAAFLPEPWSAAGITVLLLVGCLSLLGRWPGHAFRLESVGLGYQPDGQANRRGNDGRSAPESRSDAASTELPLSSAHGIIRHPNPLNS